MLLDSSHYLNLYCSNTSARDKRRGVPHVLSPSLPTRRRRRRRRTRSSYASAHPSSRDTSNVLRKSSRIGPTIKRSYDGMQSRYNRVGRPHKKFKERYQVCLLVFSAWPLGTSLTKATERSVNNTTIVNGVRDTADDSPDGDPAIDAPSKVI
jgi:hypothetical protein